MRRTTVVISLGFLVLVGVGPVRSEEPKPPALKRLMMADVQAWKSVRGAVLSNDGQWLAYRLAPNEGDGEVVLRQVQGDKETKFPAGESRGGGFFPGLGGGDTAFSHDSKWLAFTVYPLARENRPPAGETRPTSARTPPQNKAALVNLATGEKVEFENMRRFAFSGEAGNWIALQKAPAGRAPVSMPPADGTSPASLSPSVSPAPTGADLLLHELATGNELNLGNVSEFAFDKKGQWLALVIDAQGQAGNGVQLRNMTTGVLLPLDTAKATYRHLNWTEKGDAIAVLRGTQDKPTTARPSLPAILGGGPSTEPPGDDRHYVVVGFTELSAAKPQKVVYDPKTDPSFPKEMAISPNRSPSPTWHNPSWTEDLSALLFGIYEPKKKPTPVAQKAPDKTKPTPGADSKTPSRTATPPRDKPDLVIWHWTDDRLQPQQERQAGSDRNFSYLCEYRVKEKKFIRLADRTLRQVNVAPKQRYAIGTDNRAYQLMGSLDGRNFQDVYVIDMLTGVRKLALKKARYFSTASPDGTHFLYYEDGHFYTYDMASGESYNVTKDTPTSFVNTEDDHNVVKPPTRPFGWSKDGKFVLISDNWDIWSVPVHGGAGVNLTVDGKRDGIRYRFRVSLDPEEKGIDLAGPVYFSIYGETSKKAGYARLDGGKPGTTRILWDDAEFVPFTLRKAKNADVFVFTRETVKDYPDYYAADKSLQNARKLTNANPQQSKYGWTKGSRLVNYTSANGVKLQAALFLPGDYQEHKRYPTIVYIYEKLSQNLNHYPMPAVGGGGFNLATYLSHGYAVLEPDIVYQVNDPGRSAVACVLPALEAAIATGIVDRDRVGLHGHSWGGYQTAFLITQTDAFKAAVAGAPLTNLISMYSSIYWNVGIANQPIFESSQGRFTGGYWENLEAYMRNSPVYFAKNVHTPLLLLHNDKDGAVDFNQGIEYFNTLRRLQKPVVMLQYKGENHGLVKAANQRDYALRMRHFFDFYLRDKPAPKWLKEGVPHLEMAEHLAEKMEEIDN